MKKCECRWSCDGHPSAYPKSKENPDMKGYCLTLCYEERFVRVTCISCDRVRIYSVCPDCWARIKRWIRSNSTFHCDACSARNHTQEQWSIYEDVRS